MRIVIDGRSLTTKATGISNFLINAINSLSNNQKIEIYIFVHKHIDLEIIDRLYCNTRIKIIKKPLFIFPNSGLLWFFLKLPFLINSIQADVFWGPGQVLPFFLNKKIKKMVTIHDFVFKYYAETMSFKSRIENKIFTSKSINNADYIWCVSEYTKEELTKLYLKRKCRKIFVGSGIDINIFKKKSFSEIKKNEILNKYKVNRPLILCVGTLEPRKNFEFLIRLMPKLAKEGVSMLIVGNSGWGNPVKNIRSSNCNISYTGYIDIGELVNLYNVADLYVSSSLNEGFGMPILEAIVCGCPVVTPHNSAMIELGTTFGTTVMGWDESIWIETILKLFKENKGLDNLNEKKLVKYDWTVISEKIYEYLNDGINQTF